MNILPRYLVIRQGARRLLPNILSALKCTRPLLITDPFMHQHGHANELCEIVAQQQKESLVLDVFHKTVPEPNTNCLKEALSTFRKGNYDCIVALGGGSPIDIAKAVSVIGHDEMDLSKYRVPNTPKDGIPVIAMPTTAGTGSEVTRATVITDSITNEKILCMASCFQPVAALVDYEYSLTCPPSLTAFTGIDALTHAIESYVSQKQTLFTDAMALSAMSAIWRHIKIVYKNPLDHESRKAMMNAATLAGIAFSNASVALVHGMARPIGAHFHVPHGLSNAMLLPTVTLFSSTAATSRYADCARAMGVADTSVSDETAVKALIQGLQQLNEDLKVPSPKAYGIDRKKYEDLIPLMVKQALASGSPGNNPRIPSEAEMAELYLRAYEGDRQSFK